MRKVTKMAAREPFPGEEEPLMPTGQGGTHSDAEAAPPGEEDPGDGTAWWDRSKLSYVRPPSAHDSAPDNTKRESYGSTKFAGGGNDGSEPLHPDGESPELVTPNLRTHLKLYTRPHDPIIALEAPTRYITDSVSGSPCPVLPKLSWHSREVLSSWGVTVIVLVTYVIAAVSIALAVLLRHDAHLDAELTLYGLVPVLGVAYFVVLGCLPLTSHLSS
jgi:hypothetical protein